MMTEVKPHIFELVVAGISADHSHNGAEQALRLPPPYPGCYAQEQEAAQNYE